jgi:acetyltransferase-like isoleucine patch superfamily enzyme
VKKNVINKLKYKARYVKKIGILTIVINKVFKMFRRDSCYRFSLHYTSQIISPENFIYNKDNITLISLAVSGGCYFQANNKIIFGKNCLIAPGVKIISSNHNKTNKEIIKETPIIIGDDVWIGANAILLPGVEIGNNCIVGAGAVVTKSFKDEHTVIVGNPAQNISKVKG